ncbi:MAG: PAS domain-containing protein [Acidobacteriota bacterium]|nr:MAG: PAS domain-containing protein [Acidobacteriota bacterium]
MAYLVTLHVVFASCAVWFLRDRRVWLIAVELFFVVSLGVGVYLVRAYFAPLKSIESGAQYLRDGEYTTRFTPTGQADMDRLLDVYNCMADRLREERIHNEEQEQLLRKVMAASPGGVITLDVDGKVDSVNPAAEALLQADAKEMIGQPLDALGTPLARQLAEVPPDHSRLVPVRGRHRVRCQAASFMDRGFPRKFLILDELTDELHRTEKQAYEKLIRMMSHEVNNTSGAVQSLLQSCLAYRRQLTDGDREDFAKALEMAIQRTAHLDEFMRGFANVVRLPRPALQPTNPWEIALQVGLLFRDGSHGGTVTWREEIEPNLPSVPCDPVQMEQALLNVIKNAVEAIQATGGLGEIVVRGGRRGRRAFLSVADSGSGLSPEVQAQLFTPFYTTRENGQGIGLTMVQEILLAHGFDFTLENRPSGGAEFTILF